MIGIQNKASDIYMREIVLFRDHIPILYNNYIKYVDFYQFNKNEFPSLLFVCNFEKFTSSKYLSYQYHSINRSRAIRDYENHTITKYKESINTVVDLTLSTNFVFIPLCDARNRYKYSFELNRCVAFASCTSDNTGKYCIDDNTPLTCNANYFINLYDNNTIVCFTYCDEGKMRLPGSPELYGICNTNCPDNINNCPSGSTSALKDYQSNFQCNINNNYFRLDYTCYSEDNIENSGVFISSCYNFPNFFHNFVKTQELTEGYIFEIWFMLDNVLNGCKIENKEIEYYLWSNPHILYKNGSTFYYAFYSDINNPEKIEGINLYEWNKLLIEVKIISNTNKIIKVYLNFDLNNPRITKPITNNSNVMLNTIGFCSTPDNGECQPSGTNIYWGSAYYKNLRIWDLSKASLQTVQSYNNKQYFETITGLVLFYPFTIDKIDINDIIETINGEDMYIQHSYTKNFDTNDNFTFINYATNFDWISENSGYYISNINGTDVSLSTCNIKCLRCWGSTDSTCYECDTNNGYVLVNTTCYLATGFFMKTPTQNSQQTVDFNLISGDSSNTNVNTLTTYTFSIWMKFLGVEKSTQSTEPKLIILREDIYIYYAISTAYLVFNINNQNVFIDKNFKNYFGQWIQISIANYKSEDYKNIYPNMFTFMVNKIDIPIAINDYVIPDVKINTISLGYELICLWADLRIYNTFIHANYGTTMSTEKNVGIIINYNLYSSSDNGCLLPAQTASGESIPVYCIPDYHPFLEPDLQCANDDKYFDIYITGKAKPCDVCSDNCKTFCTSSSSLSCTCDLTEGLYWLRKNPVTSITYCEYIPYIDFSLINNFLYMVPVSYTLESTVEFWLYIYSFNVDAVNFESLNIEWDYHNKVQLYKNGNSIMLKCYGVYSIDEPSLFQETIDMTVTQYLWVNIKCGTSLIGKTSEHYFFLNENKQQLKTTETIDRNSTNSRLKIYSGDTNPSFGFIFIRELKLWQQSNFKYINSQYINIENNVGKYSLTNRMSDGKYPGLLAYFKNQFNPVDSTYDDDFSLDVLNLHKYKFINLLGSQNADYDEDNPFYYRFFFYRKTSNYIGYNLLNENYYDTLTICDEGTIYNEATDYCATPSNTHCEYPGDFEDNCITCDASTIFIDDNGNCLSKCPDGTYGDIRMNQCRKCHETCATCANDVNGQFGWNETNCLSCSGSLNFVNWTNPEGIEEHRCVLVCQNYGLTQSISIPNLCLDFDALAILVNVKEGVPINIDTFTNLVGKVTACTTETYNTKWWFDPDATRIANNDETMTFPSNSPFIGNVELLDTQIDNNFFEGSKLYVVVLDVYSKKIDLDGKEKIVSKSIPFTLTMNSPPENGSLTIIPENGLYNTTTFVIKCLDWEDDTAKNDELTYYIYAKEYNTDNVILLSDWSTRNEVIKNFTVQYYQQQSSIITIYCEIKDNYGSIAKISKNISISNKINNGIYNISNALSLFSIDNTNYVNLFHLSNLLMSLGINPYKQTEPEISQTVYEPSLDNTIVTMTDPKCNSDYCNSHGECDLIDEYLVCNCETGYVGRNCHIDKDSYAILEEKYNELFSIIYSNLNSTIYWEQLISIHNLFFGALQFFQNDSFFDQNLQGYLSYSLSLYKDSILNNTSEYFDLIDFYFQYTLINMNKLKLSNKINLNGNRNITLSEFQQETFKTSFNYITEEIKKYIKYYISVTSLTEFKYESKNFNIIIKKIDQNFVEDELFESRINKYRSYVHFMDCLKYIENENLKVTEFTVWFAFIEYYSFPFGYNENYFINNTSPLVDLIIYDSLNFSEINIRGCYNDKRIIFHLPVKTYKWLSEINENMLLYDPDNYLSPDDEMFTDPKYIDSEGVITTLSIQDRIDLYGRNYNFSCNYYDITNEKFSDDGISYLNYTSDENYIEFLSTHLTQFTTFMVDNNLTYHTKSRFFYLSRPRVFINWKNYRTNKFFYLLLILMLLYFVLFIIVKKYDKAYFAQEGLIEYLKREILKSFLIYNKDEDKILNALVPTGFKPGIKAKKVFGTNHNYTKNKKDIINVNMANKHFYKEEENVNIEDNFDNNDILDLNKIEDDEFENENANNNITTGKTTKQYNNFFNQSNNDINEKENDKHDFDSKPFNIKHNNKEFIDIQIALGLVGRNMKDNYNVNKLPETFENEENEYQQRLQSFSDLNLSCFKFLSRNLSHRFLIKNAIFHISIFHSRLKKITLLFTEIFVILILNAIFLTNDENIINSNKNKCFAYSLLITLITIVFMYIITCLFRIRYKQRRRLLKSVIGGGQLVILKEWDDLKKKNCLINVIGYVLCYSIWILGFYICIPFMAVWTEQNGAFIRIFIISFIFDFLILEFLTELFISIIYIPRRGYECFRKIGEFLNNVRDYRALYP